jgi:hypothetical protein
MALCRLEAKIISCSGGRSSVGAASYRTGKCATSAAAYRAGAQLKDERTGQVYDYTRKRGVAGAEIMLPEGAPEWMRDRGQLWNAVEKAEKRADAQLARDYILTLPHELSPEQRRELTRTFVERQFVDRGYVSDIAWHAPHGKGDERNHHAHVMVVMRRIEGNGFARTKERPPEGKHPAEHWKAELRAQREAWAATGADALAREGFPLEAERFRVGHLALPEQRAAALTRGDVAWAEALDREAEPKQGPLATKIEREGRESHAGTDRRRVVAENAERARLKADMANVVTLTLEVMKRGVMDEPNEELIEQQAKREAALLQQMRDQEQKIAEFKKAKEAEAEEAKKHEHEQQAEQDRAWREGDISDAGTRYGIALGKCYNIKDPYSSLAEAAMAEGAAFKAEQENLRKQAAAEKDAEKRQEIELRRKIEAHEYMSITSTRLAGICATIAGREDAPLAVLDRERAAANDAQAVQLRDERAKLQADRDRRERESVANQLGELRDSVERGSKERGDRAGEVTDAKAERMARFEAMGRGFEQQEREQTRGQDRGSGGRG